MEDGFLGKIFVGDGAKDIPCGQVIFDRISSSSDIFYRLLIFTFMTGLNCVHLNCVVISP